jgi:hypothetical protein
VIQGYYLKIPADATVVRKPGAGLDFKISFSLARHLYVYGTLVASDGKACPGDNYFASCRLRQSQQAHASGGRCQRIHFQTLIKRFRED